MGCCLATCQSNYHFMCARAQNCVFQQDRKVYCYKHRDLVSAKVLVHSSHLKLLYFCFYCGLIIVNSLDFCLKEALFSQLTNPHPHT